MSHLQFSELIRPFAALLVVDAEHERSHDDFLRIGVGVDLE